MIGATSVIRHARSKAPGTAEWLTKLLERKSARLAAVVLAISGGGALSSRETTVLMSVEDTLEALRRAEQIKYRSPGT